MKTTYPAPVENILDGITDADTADEVTITGTISGSTTCKLLLVQSNSDTAS